MREDVEATVHMPEVPAVFKRCEPAKVHNEVEALDALFFYSPHAVRHGATENRYGFDAIRAFRSASPAAGLARTLRHTSITAPVSPMHAPKEPAHAA